MKRLLWVAFGLQFACATSTGPNLKHVMVAPIQSDLIGGKDRFVEIRVQPGHSHVAIQVRNLTDEMIRIVWNDASIVTPDGRSMRLVHEGVRLADRNANQVPTAIPANSYVADDTAPTESVSFTGKDGWIYWGFIAPSWYGKEWRLVLPIVLGDGSTKLYTFTIVSTEIPRPDFAPRTTPQTHTEAEPERA